MSNSTNPIPHLGQASFFTRLSQTVARYAGRPATSSLAFGMIIVWGLSGPLFGFNDTWQLVINTSTTIITFLMVFIIQNSQNRDTAAMQIKLDELLSKVEGAREELMDLEELDDEKLAAIRDDYERRAAKARETSGRSTGADVEDARPAISDGPRPDHGREPSRIKRLSQTAAR